MSLRPTQERLDRLSDGQLVQRAQAGDQEAFAELYNRYFDRIYDFLTRMMRNRSEAEDVTQDTFIRAMRSLDRLENHSSFKSWLFTIARNTALNRLEKTNRNRPMPSVGGDSADTLEMTIVDADRLGSPHDAAQARATASLVWEAASGLNPKQYSLLDLHVRQGLDSGDIAEVLNVSRNNAYVMLNRMKAALAETVTAYIMMNEGRTSCPDLDEALERASIGRFSPAARRVVSRHVQTCDRCQARQADLVSPVAILGALVPVPAAPGVRESILDNVLDQWPAAGASSLAGDGGISRFNHQLLASTVSILVGIAILAGLLLTSIGDNTPETAQASSGTALTVVFTDEAGQRLEAVTVRIFPRDEAVPALSGVTDSEGAMTWDNAVPGTYDLVVEGLPAGIDLPDTDRARQFTIDPDEHLVLTATIRTTTE